MVEVVLKNDRRCLGVDLPLASPPVALAPGRQPLVGLVAGEPFVLQDDGQADTGLERPPKSSAAAVWWVGVPSSRRPAGDDGAQPSSLSMSSRGQTSR